MKPYKEHIYSLEDRHETDISPLWQILQILFFICCIILGFILCFVFGLVFHKTQYNCILYSNITFEPNLTDSKGNPNNIKAVTSDFPTIYCNIVIYMPIVLSTFACFFTVMFAYCGRGGAGNQSMQETWRIIMPTVFFNLISLCLTAYTTNIFQAGLKQFLRSVAVAWAKPVINLDEISHLRMDGTNIGADLVRYLTITKHITWLLVSFWGLNFLWILLRFLFNVDFQLVRTTIHVYPKTSNVMQTVGEAYRRASSSDSSTASSVSAVSYKPLLRQRTVQFTPSTVGPGANFMGRQNLSQAGPSSDSVDESKEVEIAEVTYNKNE